MTTTLAPAPACSTVFERVHRPWGWYETLAVGEGHLVKRIAVHPGQQISLQYHCHRAEHWLVVQGQARVTLGERVFDLPTGQHCDIALGLLHRLANLGEQVLEIIEIQLGADLREDDIVRISDDYGRTIGAPQ